MLITLQKAHIPKSVLAVLEEETDLLSEGGIDRGDKVINIVHSSVYTCCSLEMVFHFMSLLLLSI